MSDLENEFDKVKEKGRGKVAKRVFGFIFDGVKNDKDSIKKKALSLRKRERVIMIHQRYMICKRPACKNLKVYYYTFPKIVPKRGALSART